MLLSVRKSVGLADGDAGLEDPRDPTLERGKPPRETLDDAKTTLLDRNAPSGTGVVASFPRGEDGRDGGI